MQQKDPAVKTHYDRFLAEHYVWMAGGFRENMVKNRHFFSSHHILPRSGTIAIDLGAGCGFASVPLAEAGFRVTAVDFCQPLLDELLQRVPDRDIETIAGDILDFPVWTGKRPGLITCMGDTLTHLPDSNSVRGLIRQCFMELETGGTLVLSLRDYSQEPDGSVTIIPVRSDADRIFLCRLEYGADTVRVTDILFSRRSGSWERTAGEYAKLRIVPVRVRDMMEHAGFGINGMELENGMAVIIGRKPDQ